MRVIRPQAIAMVNAMEKNPNHPVAKHVQQKVNTDACYGVKNTYSIRVNAPKQLGMRDFQV